MSKQVDRWIAKGRKNCANGHHWLILHFPDYQVCPLCGYKAKYDGMPEFNGFIVSEGWNQNRRSKVCEPTGNPEIYDYDPNFKFKRLEIVEPEKNSQNFIMPANAEFVDDFTLNSMAGDRR